MAERQEPVRVLVVGAGDRGCTYANHVRARPTAGRVVAVAEPDRTRRERFVQDHGIDAERSFDDWRPVLDAGRVADAVVIATLDQDHAAPAIAFADAGWDILLEKPMAPTPDECRSIVAAVKRAGVLLAVCHVLRYTAYTRAIKRLLDEDAIGDVVGVQRLEPVGWWHFAHAYVRGNWRREADCGSVLLAKCCHDLDWISCVVGSPVAQVSSFAGLHHFRPDRAPTGAATRCVDCEIEPGCAYSALKLYLGELERGHAGWPVSVVADPTDEASVRRALREGPYGRCVYACDNDVPDHQVVIQTHTNGAQASLTMSAFTPARHRQTRIFGSHGWLVGDGERIEHHDFRTDVVRRIDVAGAGERHGGGDGALVEAFLSAVAAQDASRLLSGPDETLDSHLTVFAAERARRERRVVSLADYSPP